MLDHDSLGSTGGARGVNDVRQASGRQPGGRRGRIDGVAIFLDPIDHIEHVGNRGIPPAGAIFANRVGQQSDRLGVLQDVAHLLIGEERIDAGVCRPRLENRELRKIEMLGIAWQQNRHHALFGNDLAQSVGERVRLPLEIGVRDLTATQSPRGRRRLDGDAVRPAPGRLIEKLMEQRRLVRGGWFPGERLVPDGWGCSSRCHHKTLGRGERAVTFRFRPVHGSS